MENIQENYIKNIENIIDEADRMNISNFTYELFDCIYSDDARIYRKRDFIKS